MYYGNKVALENLNNNSVCVSDRDGIRNIRDEYDLVNSNLVFVCNIVPEGILPNYFFIQEGDMVRYKRIFVAVPSNEIY